MFKTRGRKQNRRLFFLAIVVVVLATVISAATLSILPGFEGVQNGADGYQVQGTSKVVALGNPLPSQGGGTYSWVGSPTPGSASVQVSTPPILTCPNVSCNNVLVIDEQTNPVSYLPPFSSPIQVSYYVPVPGSQTQKEYVTGTVEEYTYTIDISIQSGAAGTWNFGGDTIWSTFSTNTWNLASTDPNNSSVSGSVYEAPLYAVVSNVQWSQKGSNDVDAAVQGHPFTFYTTPSTTGLTLANTGCNLSSSPTNNLNASLASKYAPSTCFPNANGLVYYPISLLSFKANPFFGEDCALGCNYPSVQLTVTLYTLRFGQYILNNPSTTGLGTRTESCTGGSCVTNDIGALLSDLTSPLAIIFEFLLLVVVILVALVLLGFSVPFLHRARRPGAGRGSSVVAVLLFVALVGLVLIQLTPSLSVETGASNQMILSTAMTGFEILGVVAAAAILYVIRSKKRRRSR